LTATPVSFSTVSSVPRALKFLQVVQAELMRSVRSAVVGSQ